MPVMRHRCTTDLTFPGVFDFWLERAEVLTSLRKPPPTLENLEGSATQQFNPVSKALPPGAGKDMARLSLRGAANNLHWSRGRIRAMRGQAWRLKTSLKST
jgi:hypothetical protein